jgi:hypothetical protein
MIIKMAKDYTDGVISNFTKDNIRKIKSMVLGN